jgi:predicted phosphoribosyltransferase
MRQLLKNRSEAGRLLVAALRPYATESDLTESDLLVLALPRGGVPVAFEVAKAFGAPLDVFLVRKLGVPGHEELALGAVANGGIRVLNHDVVRLLDIPPKLIDDLAKRETLELNRREAVYRKGLGPLRIEDRALILIDDGLATGSTMLAALRAIRSQKPRQIVAAVPVSPPSACEQLRGEADALICLMTPEPFYGVGQWYEDFSQTNDDEVVELLQAARGWTGDAESARRPGRGGTDHASDPHPARS